MQKLNYTHRKRKSIKETLLKVKKLFEIFFVKQFSLFKNFKEQNLFQSKRKKDFVKSLKVLVRI